MRSPKIVVAAMACLPLAVAGPAAAAQAKSAPKIKVFTTKTVSSPVVAPQSSGEFFQERASVAAKCGRGYQPLALGIASATNPLAAQDLGFVGMSVYASGAAGTTRTRLQALCVRGGRAPSYIGEPVELGATGAGTALKASLSCRTGQVALGAALAHGHAPAFGGYASMPDGKRRWTYTAQIPSSVAGQLAGRVSQAGYPRAACVRATGVTTAEFKSTVSPTAPAVGTATCKRGRVLGWGVDLGAHRSRPGSNGAWAIPTIGRAQFTGTRSMAFRFVRDNDPGANTGATPVRALVICGALPRG